MPSPRSSSVPNFSNPAALPSGFHAFRIAANDVGFWTYVWKGDPGPTLLINGATHGDEYEGPTLLRTWAAHWRPRRLKGTLIAVPVLNEGAFAAGRRVDPRDNADLARAFPGGSKDAPTARLAHLFDQTVLAYATHYVDLHSAGNAYELLPWVGFMACAEPIQSIQRQMAESFEGFWCWAGPHLSGRTLSAAYERGVAAIYVECKGAGSICKMDLRKLELGLKHLMQRLGMLPGKSAAIRKQPFRNATDPAEAHLQVHHPAPVSGLFIPSPQCSLGRRVRSGQSLGQILPIGPGDPVPVKSERAGRLVFLRRQRSVQKGDALCVVTPV